LNYNITGGSIEIDEEDKNLLDKYSIHIGNKSVLINLPNRITKSLGRFLLNYNGKDEVDHKDKNYLNYKRNNLRILDHSSNCHNRSVKNSTGFRGVSKLKSGKYQAKIKQFGYNIYLGLFNNPISAAKVYDKEARKLFGEAANTNF
jgi:hypothetical protein